MLFGYGLDITCKLTKPTFNWDLNLRFVYFLEMYCRFGCRDSVVEKHKLEQDSGFRFLALK